MLTVQDLGNRILRNLWDEGVVFYTLSDCLTSIQDAYDEVVVYSECIEKTTTIPFQANLIYYDFYNGIPDFYRPASIFNQATGRWLPFQDTKQFLKTRFDWELAVGTPWFYSQINFQFTAFYPHLRAAGESFDLFYKAKADKLTTDSIPSVPDTYVYALENYATADLLEQVQEFKKASDYWQKYYKQIEDLRVDVITRMHPDKIRQYSQSPTWNT